MHNIKVQSYSIFMTTCLNWMGLWKIGVLLFFWENYGKQLQNLSNTMWEIDGSRWPWLNPFKNTTLLVITTHLPLCVLEDPKKLSDMFKFLTIILVFEVEKNSSCDKLRKFTAQYLCNIIWLKHHKRECKNYWVFCRIPFLLQLNFDILHIYVDFYWHDMNPASPDPLIFALP